MDGRREVVRNEGRDVGRNRQRQRQRQRERERERGSERENGSEWVRAGGKPQPAPPFSSAQQPPSQPFASDEENKFVEHLYESARKISRYLCVCERDLSTEKLEERVKKETIDERRCVRERESG